jgi:hypothetical protein
VHAFYEFLREYVAYLASHHPLPTGSPTIRSCRSRNWEVLSLARFSDYLSISVPAFGTIRNNVEMSKTAQTAA